ncbi:MAG: hypothetical protein QOI24_1317 [Acidobacteriota bacterium]|jgi:uncharacterized ferritin-like protein (DUF455 family)|nr:hypothetical protein [Acidobacteriota bacterium]
MSDNLDPRLFGEGPKRDSRFVVGEVWSEMTNFDASDPELIHEFLHRQMNEEINGMEISARNLADFPEAPWELRMSMARQCWDEARHIDAFRGCFERRGVTVGQYPVMNFQYRLITNLPSLLGRLAVQNRSFEAAGIDAIQNEVAEAARREGRNDLDELFDAQLADEVQHVRYANVWVKKLMQSGGAAAVFELTKAVSLANEALKLVAGDAATMYPVAEDIRREAGFTDDEIEVAKRLVAQMSA